jgi:hypothetical protein
MVLPEVPIHLKSYLEAPLAIARSERPQTSPTGVEVQEAHSGSGGFDGRQPVLRYRSEMGS